MQISNNININIYSINSTNTKELKQELPSLVLDEKQLDYFINNPNSSSKVYHGYLFIKSEWRIG